MEVTFSPELEAKLRDSAARQGRDPDQLARDVVSRYFEEETRFAEAVKRGEDAFSMENTSRTVSYTHLDVYKRQG